MANLEAALSLALAGVLCLPANAQAPAGLPQPTAGVRLVYELPVDALQRTLRGQPELDLEQLLARSVATIEQRVGDHARVTRDGATGFVVDVPAGEPAALQRLRRRVEAAGTLTFGVIASAAQAQQHLRPDLASGRAELSEWLDGGGRERLLADPSSIGASAELGQRFGLRWVVRRIHARRDDAARWEPSFRENADLRDATVALYTDEQWNEGAVPAGLRGEHAHLIELVAIHVAAGTFAHDDLDLQKVRVGQPGPRVEWWIGEARRGAFADWTGRFVGSYCAIACDGELRMAPRLQGAVPGLGSIGPLRSVAEAEDLALTLRSGALPAPPKLLRQEACPAKDK